MFAGSEVVEFDVEIVGTLPGIAPDQNLILGLCTGGPLTDTRILSGMSGSPVFVDGKLIGAVAYSWGFSTATVAGGTQPLHISVGKSPKQIKAELQSKRILQVWEKSLP